MKRATKRPTTAGKKRRGNNFDGKKAIKINLYYVGGHCPHTRVQNKIQSDCTIIDSFVSNKTENDIKSEMQTNNDKIVKIIFYQIERNFYISHYQMGNGKKFHSKII